MKEPRARGYHQSIRRNSDEHLGVATLALTEADRVLHLFENHRPKDDRPRRAIEALRDWIGGEKNLMMAIVRELSLGAHAAARSCSDEPAKLAARAAGQAIATWHVPTHWTAARQYAGKARTAAESR